MTAISTRAISRSTCAPEPPLVQPDNQSLLLSARSPDSIQRYAPPARSGSSAPPPPSAAGAPFPSPTTSRYSGACAISPPRAPGAPRSASALPSNIASPTMPRSRVVSLAIAACARTSSIPGATPPFSTSKCSTLAEPRDYAGFKPFGALAAQPDDDAEARLVAHHPLVRILGLLQREDLVAGGDARERAEGERLLRVLRGAARPSLDPPALADELQRADLDRLRSRPEDDQRAVAGEAVDELARQLGARRGSEDDPGAAEPLQRRRGVALVGVDVLVGAQLERECALVPAARKSDRAETQLARILDAQVAQTADGVHGDEVAGAGPTVAQRVEGGDAGAEEWCRGNRIERIGHGGECLLRRHHVFGVPAVIAEAADEPVLTQDEVARAAGLANAAVPAVPADPNPLARLPGGHALADGIHPSDHLMAGDPRVDHAGKLPFLDERIRVTDAASLDGDAHLAPSCVGDGLLDELEGRPWLRDLDGSHRPGHAELPPGAVSLFDAADAREEPGRAAARLLGSLGVHPEDFPVVTVEVVEAPAVHEAVILRFGGVLPAGRDGLPDHLVDLGPAVARQRKQSFGLPGRVAQLALGERLEEGLREKHHVRFLADDHAGRLVVRELRIELEAELREELHRLLQVADGQVDEELPGTIGCHGSLLGLDLQFTARTGRTPRSRSSRNQRPAQRTAATYTGKFMGPRCRVRGLDGRDRPKSSVAAKKQPPSPPPLLRREVSRQPEEGEEHLGVEERVPPGDALT